MTRPVRLQLSRKRGFRLQPHSRAVNGLDAVNVARPGKWGNPFRVGFHGSAEECVTLFRAAMERRRETLFSEIWISEGGNPAMIELACKAWILDLRGKNLACWCKPGEPCHADVLIELANAGQGEARKPEPDSGLPLSNDETASRPLPRPAGAPAAREAE